MTSHGEEDWTWVDGVPFSLRFGDVFHSRSGALAQAEAVFLRGAGLPERWRGRRTFAVLENGFGFGVNALVTLAAWCADPQRSRTLDYVAIDAYPRSRAAMAVWWGEQARTPTLARLADALLAGYPPPSPGFHRLWLAGGAVRVTLVWLPAAEAARQIVGQFDALYLDGFAPAKNPAMWEAGLLAALVRRLAPGGRVATWSCAGAVRRALAAAGLTVVRQPGFGGKRERLEAYRNDKGPPRPVPPQRVAVVGAGLAGAAAAQALAERGVAVTLFDAHPQPASGASGNPAGAARWLPSRDDNLLAQWTRSGFLTLTRRWPQWAALGAKGAWCGALQVARRDADAERMAEALARLPWLADLIAFLDREAASAAAGVMVAHGGWWFPAAGWVVPPTLVQAWLASAPLLELRSGATVTALEPDEGGWRVVWAEGGCRQHARFDAVVLAVGAGATPLWPTQPLPLGAEPAHPGLRLPVMPVRGQVSWAEVAALAPLRTVVTGSGYVIPAAATGMPVFGAAAAPRDWRSQLLPKSHAENGARLAAMVPGAQPTPEAPYSGRVSWRAATHDHLPAVGALSLRGRWDDPRRWQSGLWVVNGLGSRGIAIAPLAGELLAASLCGEPLPVGRTLAEAVDPARFARRADLLYSSDFDS